MSIDTIYEKIPNNSFIFGPDCVQLKAGFKDLHNIEVDNSNIYPSAAVLGIMAESLDPLPENVAINPMFLCEPALGRN